MPLQKLPTIAMRWGLLWVLVSLVDGHDPFQMSWTARYIFALLAAVAAFYPEKK